MRGLRVLDLSSSLAGAYCTRLLAGVGADVVSAEPPGGSPLRHAAPMLTAVDGSRRSAMWEHVAAGKRSVVVDDMDPLLRWAELVVSSTNGDPDDALALHDRIAAQNPQAVHVVCSGYGLTGPYRTWRHTDFTDWAAGGHAYITGEPDREPLQGGGPWMTYCVGATAAIGAQVAVIDAVRTGHGQLVDVGAMEAATGLHQWSLTMYTHTGCIKRRWGNLLGESCHPIALYRCADGYISIVAVTQLQWESLCLTMELYDLLADPTLEAICERFDRAAEIDEQINAWLATRTTAEVVEQLQAANVPATVLLTMSQVLDEEQLDERGFWLPAPAFGPDARLPGLPFRLDGVALRPAPALGEHTASVLASLDDPIDTPRPVVDLSRQRVVEFGVAWAGPLVGRLLGDIGLDVVKVEHPASRGLPPNASYADGWKWGELPHPQVRFHVFPDARPGEHWWNRMGIFNKMNRSKRSLALDAKPPEGREVLRDLMATSDVVLHNYSPRGAASLGVDAASVEAANPMAITVAMTGYGETGPLSSYLSYGPILQAHAGFDEATGYVGAGPTRLGVAFPDPVGGLHGTFAVLAALWERAATQQPVHVDQSQLESLLTVAGEMLLATSATGRDPARHGNQSPDHAPQNMYRCAGDDAWLAMTIVGDDEWRALVALIGDPLLDALASADVHERRQRHAAIDARITAWTSTRTPMEATVLLQERGIAAIPAMTNQDLVEDPHLNERGMIAMIDQPDVGVRGYPGFPIHFERSTVRLFPCPTFGQDNAAILTELLGYDEAKVAELEARGVIAPLPLYR